MTSEGTPKGDTPEDVVDPDELTVEKLEQQLKEQAELISKLSSQLDEKQQFIGQLGEEVGELRKTTGTQIDIKELADNLNNKIFEETDPLNRMSALSEFVGDAVGSSVAIRANAMKAHRDVVAASPDLAGVSWNDVEYALYTNDMNLNGVGTKRSMRKVMADIQKANTQPVDVEAIKAQAIKDYEEQMKKKGHPANKPNKNGNAGSPESNPDLSDSRAFNTQMLKNMPLKIK